MTNLDKVTEAFSGIGEDMGDAAELYEQSEHAAAEAMSVPDDAEPGN